MSEYIIKYDDLYYLAEFREIEHTENHSKGWVVLRKVTVDGYGNLLLRSRIQIKPSLSRDSAMKYLDHHRYITYYPSDDDAGEFIGKSKDNTAGQPQCLKQVNYNFYTAFLTGKVEKDIFQNFPQHLDFIIDPEAFTDTLLTVNAGRGGFKSLTCDKCFLMFAPEGKRLKKQSVDSIIIKNSVIGEFKLYKDTVNGDVIIDNCSILNINFNKVQILGDFKCTSYFRSIYGATMPLHLEEVHFKNKFIFDQSRSDYQPWSYRVNSIDFFDCLFQKSCFISGYCPVRFYSNRVEGLFEYLMGGDTSNHFLFECINTSFLGPVLIDKPVMSFSAFDFSTFSNSFAVVNNSYWKSEADSNYMKTHNIKQLSASNFDPGAKLIVDPQEEVNFYKISLYSLANIDLLFTTEDIIDTNLEENKYVKASLYNIVTDTLGKDIYHSTSSYIGALQDYVSRYQTTDVDQKNEVLDKVHYWKSVMEMDYLHTQGRLSWRKRMLWLLNWLPLLTANFGYNGAWIFVLSSFIIIVILSAAFLVKSHKVLYYQSVGGEINGSFEDESRLLKSTINVGSGFLNQARYWIPTWFSCFWLAAFIYVNPKFPIKFFYINGWLFVCMCICWAIGIIMLLILLIFIAAKASFLRTLLAL